MARKKMGPRPKFNPGHKTDVLLDVYQVAERFKVTAQTVRKWWNQGYLASHKIRANARRYYSTESDCVEWAKIYYEVGVQPHEKVPDRSSKHDPDCKCFHCTFDPNTVGGS